MRPRNPFLGSTIRTCVARPRAATDQCDLGARRRRRPRDRLAARNRPPPSADLTAFVPPGDGCHAAPIKHRVDPAHRGEREAGYPDAWPTHLTWAGLLLPTLVFVG